MLHFFLFYFFSQLSKFVTLSKYYGGTMLTTVSIKFLFITLYPAYCTDTAHFADTFCASMCIYIYVLHNYYYFCYQLQSTLKD